MEPFRFKQFTVRHDRCAMKVGTDGVLLGAWADLSGANRILDIGTGTGLIALMAAQRHRTAFIDAVEIEESAYLQAVDNFRTSVWADRLQAYHHSIQEWSAQCPSEYYDVIVSNPPFFEQAHHSLPADNQRQTARSTVSLSYQDLIQTVLRLLQADGRFCLILPSQQGQTFQEAAEARGLFLVAMERVAPRKGKPDSRWLMAFTKQKSANIAIRNWAIREQDKIYDNYTTEYKELTRDFYLFIP